MGGGRISRGYGKSNGFVPSTSDLPASGIYLCVPTMNSDPCGKAVCQSTALPRVQFIWRSFFSVLLYLVTPVIPSMSVSVPCSLLYMKPVCLPVCV